MSDDQQIPFDSLETANILNIAVAQ